MSQKKRAHIISSFTDAGTGESFAAGTTPPIDPGAYGNYEAAGLVCAPPAKPAPKAKTVRKAKAKASPRNPPRAPAPAPVAPSEPVADAAESEADI